MPVTAHDSRQETIYQRAQYDKGGLGRLYWDYRDDVALSFLDRNDRFVLDVGCGEGITLEKLATRFPESRILGIDLIEENIEICRRHGLAVQLGSASKIELPDSSVDAVLLMEVIEHLERPETILFEILRVLRPNGKLVIVFPNDASFKLARLATLRFKEAAYDAGHLRQWTPREIEPFISTIGFEPLATRITPFFFWRLSLHGITFARKRVVIE